MEVRRGDGSVIAVEVAGEQGAAPVLLCHGLADSRLSARLFTQAARELGLCIMAPDRPGVGGTDPRRLGRLADWVEDAALVLDGVRAGPAALLGISAGGPFAAACAARIPGRVRSLTLVCPLGLPGWPTRGMAPGERLSLAVARHAPAFGGWFLDRLAVLARRSPPLFLRRSRGVAQDLRVLTRPWGFQLGSITVPASIHHGNADTTVPPRHARLYAEAIPGAQLHLYPGHGHFSILAAAREMLAPLAR